MTEDLPAIEILLSVSIERSHKLEDDGWTIEPHHSFPHSEHAYALAWRALER